MEDLEVFLAFDDGILVHLNGNLFASFVVVRALSEPAMHRVLAHKVSTRGIAGLGTVNRRTFM